MGWLPLLSAEAQTLCPVRLTHAQLCSELPCAKSSNSWTRLTYASITFCSTGHSTSQTVSSLNVAGRTRLRLTPRALEYVAARLQRLEELESLKRLSPVGCGMVFCLSA